jgi:hypothetical protein
LSHSRERKEKVCLNCHSDLYGRFCHVCGQENLVPQETVWHLVQHFFNDITHFDGKFFSTVKYLLRKPGFLSSEYMIGRRASYLNPIRMYVFTSAIFFIIFFSLKSDNIVKVDTQPGKPDSGENLADLQKEKTRLETKLKAADADDKEDIQHALKNLALETATIRRVYGDTTTRRFSGSDKVLLLLRSYSDSLDLADLPPEVRDRVRKELQSEKQDQGSNFFGWHQGQFRSLAEYDSTQQSLPDSLKDGWFKRPLMRKLVASEEKFRKDKRGYFEQFGENMLHSFPKILFFSLPFFALLLDILYFRRKNYLYVNHGIFTIHIYCATFILSLGVVLLDKLSKSVHVAWVSATAGILAFGLVLYMIIYLYKAMRRFYKQRRAKTLIKYFLLCLMAFIVNMILLLIFLVITAVNV